MKTKFIFILMLLMTLQDATIFAMQSDAQETRKRARTEVTESDVHKPKRKKRKNKTKILHPPLQTERKK